MHPIYILLDTSNGGSRVLEAANKWIWELNSPVSPGSNATIISSNIEWNYRLKDVLYFVHTPAEESGAQTYRGLYEDQNEATRVAGPAGDVVTLMAKRYGSIVLYLKEAS